MHHKTATEIFGSTEQLQYSILAHSEMIGSFSIPYSLFLQWKGYFMIAVTLALTSTLTLEFKSYMLEQLYISKKEAYATLNGLNWLPVVFLTSKLFVNLPSALGWSLWGTWQFEITRSEGISFLLLVGDGSVFLISSSVALCKKCFDLKLVSGASVRQMRGSEVIFQNGIDAFEQLRSRGFTREFQAWLSPVRTTGHQLVLDRGENPSNSYHCSSCREKGQKLKLAHREEAVELQPQRLEQWRLKKWRKHTLGNFHVHCCCKMSGET